MTMKTDTGNKNTTEPTEERVLHIRFKRGDTEGIASALAALDRGESPDPHFEVVFHDPAELHQVTRPKNLELLYAIASEAPKSMRETARLVDRDIRQVHQNLNELESLGLIDFEQAGRSKRPHVWYDSISVDLPLDWPVDDGLDVEA